MLQPATLTFLTQLRDHNEKPWFDAHRDAYETARQDFLEFVSDVMKAATSLEPALGGQLAKDCVYRIFRDVRFSNNKTPYKSHFSAYFSRGGRKWDGAGYYMHVEPGKVMVGGGLWMPQPALLKAVRQDIDYDFESFSKIVSGKIFRKYFPAGITGEKLQKLPQGYDTDNPAAEFLKQKSFIVSHNLADEALHVKDAVKNITAVFAVMKPFVDFLNHSQE